MAVDVELENVGECDRAEIVAAIQHVLGERPGDWRVTIIGSREHDDWEMKIHGPKEFQRSYTLVAGARQPEAIRKLLPKLLGATDSSRQ